MSNPKKIKYTKISLYLFYFTLMLSPLTFLRTRRTFQNILFQETGSKSKGERWTMRNYISHNIMGQKSKNRN